jgi:hypothetical protein
MIERPEFRNKQRMHVRLSKNNVALIVALELKSVETPLKLCVTNAHIHWDPMFTDGTLSLSLHTHTPTL